MKGIVVVLALLGAMFVADAASGQCPDCPQAPGVPRVMVRARSTDVQVSSHGASYGRRRLGSRFVGFFRGRFGR